MQITVEEIRRIKSKPDAAKKWELVALVAKGQEFTTFDLAVAEVGIGGVIEFDMELTNSGKMNIKKGWKIISKGEEPTSERQPAARLNGGEEAPEKRRSIEDQNRVGHITNLWIAGKIKDDDILISKLRTWLEKLGSQELEKKAEPSKADQKAPPPPDGEPLKDLGQLYTRAKAYGLCPRDVFESVGVGKGEEIIDLDEAWTATAKRFASAIKAASESTDK